MALLDIQDLTCAFGGLLALDKVSFQVEKGSIAGLIGPNGAGKSTLINCLTRIYQPTAGRILYRGADLLSLRSHQLPAQGMTRTFQNLELFNEATVLENVLVGCDFRYRAGLFSDLVKGKAFRRQDTLARERVHAELESLGLQTVAGTVVGTLAYGVQKRVELARALVADPELLLLDEPAAGANPSESAELGELILRLRDERGLSVLLVEHDMPLVMGICDHIVVLDHGQEISAGTPEAISTDPLVIQAYLGDEAEHA